MSNSTRLKAKTEVWFQEYLEMGHGRSLRKLIAESERIASAKGLGNPPSEATIFQWSASHGWDQRARQHDAEVSAEARQRLFRRRADTEEKPFDAALMHTELFQHVLQSALVIETPRPDDAADPFVNVANASGTPLYDRRVATPPDYEAQEWRTLIAMHKAVADTARALVQGAGERYRQFQESEQEGGAVIQVLGPEALREMAVHVNRFVKHAAKLTDQRKAEMAHAAEDDGNEQEDSSQRDPAHSLTLEDLGWEEVPDDDFD